MTLRLHMHLLKLDFWYASLVADSFLSYETIGADRDGMIEFIRRVKEELNLRESYTVFYSTWI